MTSLKKRKSAPSLEEGKWPTKPKRIKKGKDVSKNSKKQKTGDDVYEAEDSDPDEIKNANRYDDVENYEYELPSDFEDEEIDEDCAFNEEDEKMFGSWFAKKESADDDGDASEGDEGFLEPDFDEDDENNEIDDIFEGEGDLDEAPEGDSDEGDILQTKKDLRETLRKDKQGKKFNESVISEAVPESEFNINAGSTSLSVTDLLEGLGDDKRKMLKKSRKLLERLADKVKPDDAPLPKNIAERLERKAGYETTKKDVSKWQDIIKANREAPTVKFTDAHHEASRPTTLAGISSALKPETDLETQIQSLLKAAGAEDLRAVVEAEEQLALRKLDVTEAVERQKRLAKMRSLLFYNELKSKRLKAIKSKEYHRHLQKEAKKKAAEATAQGITGLVDSEAAEAAEQEALDAELERARERMSLRHRNSSQWARRALKRGKFMDEGTKAAIAEQLRLGQELRRKIEGTKGSDDEDDLTSLSEDDDAGSADHGDSSSFDASGSDDDIGSGDEGSESRSAKSVRATLKALKKGGQEGGGKAKKGLMALPFMSRAMERQRLEVQQEAEALLRELGGSEAAKSDLMDEAEEDPSFLGRGRQAFNLGGDKDGNTGYQLPFGEGGADSDADREAGFESDELEDAEAKLERMQKLKESRVRMAAATAENNRFNGKDNKASSKNVGGNNNNDYNASALLASEVFGEKMKAAGQKNEDNVFSSGSTVSVQLLGSLSSAAEKGAAKTSGVLGGGGGIKGKKGGEEGGGSSVGGATGATFIPSNTFTGTKAGYYFSKGHKGLGYYLDSHALQQKQARVALGGGAGVAASATSTTSTLAAPHNKALNAKSAQQQHHSQRKGLGERVGVSTLLEEAANAASSKAAAAAKRKGGEANKFNSNNNNNDNNNSNKGKKNDNSIAKGSSKNDDEATNVMAPSQLDLVQMAFAGDDVGAEFQAEKEALVAEEGPKIEEPSRVPGWGAWSSQQRNPKWMAQEKEKVERLREASAANRQDANLKHVIISEKWDKCASKYTTPSVPFPFTNAEVYEASVRQPLGADFNPDKSFRDLTRPAVLKESGVVIQPVRYNESTSKDLGKLHKKVEKGFVPKAAVVHVAGGVVQARAGQSAVPRKNGKGGKAGVAKKKK